MEIKFKKLSKAAKKPYKKFDVDAGFDLYSTWMKEEDKYTVYGTDIAFEIPEGFVGLLFPRSSVTNKDFMLKNSVGVVDATYRGEIMFRFIKAHNDLFAEGDYEKIEVPKDGFNNIITVPTEPWVNANHVAFRKPDYYEVGDRVGQIVFMQLPMVELNEVEKLTETKRGTAGYGSSGK